MPKFNFLPNAHKGMKEPRIAKERIESKQPSDKIARAHAIADRQHTSLAVGKARINFNQAKQ